MTNIIVEFKLTSKSVCQDMREQPSSRSKIDQKCRDFDINCQAQIPFHKNPWVQQSPQKEGIGLGNITTGKNIEMIYNFSWWFLQSGLCLLLQCPRPLIVEFMAWDSRVERLWIYVYKTKSWFPRKCLCVIIAKSVELKILLQLYHQDEVLLGSNSMVLILILLLLLRNLCHTDRQMDGH